MYLGGTTCRWIFVRERVVCASRFGEIRQNEFMFAVPVAAPRRKDIDFHHINVEETEIYQYRNCTIFV